MNIDRSIDLNASGWGHPGVRRAGAADPLALAAANLLAGAPADAPAVEMTLLGATFAVRRDVVVGLAGADMEAHVPEEDRRLAPAGSYSLWAGTTLVFGTALDGARAYPVPAVVASIALPYAGQLQPGDEVRFAWIGLAEAHRRAQTRTDRLVAIAASLT